MSQWDIRAFPGTYLKFESALELITADNNIDLMSFLSEPVLLTARIEAACRRLVCKQNVVLSK